MKLNYPPAWFDLVMILLASLGVIYSIEAMNQKTQQKQHLNLVLKDDSKKSYWMLIPAYIATTTNRNCSVTVNWNTKTVEIMEEGKQTITNSLILR
jgi:hypothetical protein